MFMKAILLLLPYILKAKDLNEIHSDLLQNNEKPITFIQAHSIYQDFVKNYKKNYSAKRFHNFFQSLKQIRNHNSIQNKTWSQGINFYSDYTEKEFQQLFTIQDPQSCSATNHVSIESKGDLPEEWDWRDHHGVSPVKNQGHCGSCWTFSTVGAMEAHYLIFYQKELYFAEQQLVDCAQAFDNHGCNGGLPSHAFEYIHYNGITTEEKYPYYAQDRECTYNPKMADGFVLHGSYNITQNDENSVKEAIVRAGPVSVAFQVVDGFKNYKSGVYRSDVCKNGPEDVNHAVLAVGYGVEEGVKHWIVKNSWSADWGDQGYFKIERDVNMCGIAQCNSFPNLGQLDKISTLKVKAEIM